MRVSGAWCSLVLLTQVGCALLSKSDPFVSRYFSPEVVAAPTTTRSNLSMSSRGAVDAEPLELRLGRVNAASTIKDQIMFRSSVYEIGYYEGRRWTERPEAYVRRALGRALFHRVGIRQIAYGSGTTLDVDVIAFEEVRGPPHVGRVDLDYSLVDHGLVLFTQSVAIERPIANTKGDAVADGIVEAVSMALSEAVDRLADRVAVELRAESSTAPPDGTAASQ